MSAVVVSEPGDCPETEGVAEGKRQHPCGTSGQGPWGKSSLQVLAALRRLGCYLHTCEATWEFYHPLHKLHQELSIHFFFMVSILSVAYETGAFSGGDLKNR